MVFTGFRSNFPDLLAQSVILKPCEWDIAIDCLVRLSERGFKVFNFGTIDLEIEKMFLMFKIMDNFTSENGTFYIWFCLVMKMCLAMSAYSTFSVD